MLEHVNVRRKMAGGSFNTHSNKRSQFYVTEEEIVANSVLNAMVKQRIYFEVQELNYAKNSLYFSLFFHTLISVRMGVSS